MMSTQTIDPATMPGAPVWRPTNLPVVHPPSSIRCDHCRRNGYGMTYWPPQSGWWVCAPGVSGCWCDDSDCCGTPLQPGDELHRIRGFQIELVGIVLEILGRTGERRYLVDLADGGREWIAEAELTD